MSIGLILFLYIYLLTHLSVTNHSCKLFPFCHAAVIMFMTSSSLLHLHMIREGVYLLQRVSIVVNDGQWFLQFEYTLDSILPTYILRPLYSRAFCHILTLVWRLAAKIWSLAYSISHGTSLRTASLMASITLMNSQRWTQNINFNIKISLCNLRDFLLVFEPFCTWIWPHVLFCL